jgi:hypothetical protein
MKSVNGVAIALAWPHTTARGDEHWCSVLKTLGIVKNLNFRVGHAAIILINQSDSIVRYYDFGRYITPRGYGRTRSMHTDPKLTFKTRAIWNNYGQIANLQDILLELESKAEATHGKGPILSAVNYKLDINLCIKRAEMHVQAGIVPYGALAPGNNSCSRFVWSVLKTGSSRLLQKIYFHETIMPSPSSNVVAIAENNQVVWFENGKLTTLKLGRVSGFRFFIEQLSHNFISEKASLLPDDHLDHASKPLPPTNRDAKYYNWLFGLGESAWFLLSSFENRMLTLQKIDINGQFEYTQTFELPSGISEISSLSIEYGTNFQKAVLEINGNKYTLFPSKLNVNK